MGTVSGPESSSHRLLSGGVGVSGTNALVGGADEGDATDVGVCVGAHFARCDAISLRTTVRKVCPAKAPKIAPRNASFPFMKKPRMAPQIAPQIITVTSLVCMCVSPGVIASRGSLAQGMAFA